VEREPAKLAAGLVRVLQETRLAEELARKAYSSFQGLYAKNRIGRFIELAYLPTDAASPG
jgi:hypothetical protein